LHSLASSICSFDGYATGHGSGASTDSFTANGRAVFVGTIIVGVGEGTVAACDSSGLFVVSGVLQAFIRIVIVIKRRTRVASLCIEDPFR
jgi:uncharacterized membrane protein YedE/YeeE